MNAQAGRGIAAVGAVLAFVAIWIHALNGRSYWNFDRTVGVFLIILACLAVLALLGAVAAGMTGQADRALLFVGAILFGFYLFFPAAFATDQWDLLDAGAWLGLSGAGLVTIGAMVAHAAGSGRPAEPAGRGGLDPPMLVGLLGVVLVVVSIWTKLETGAGSYWNLSGAGHSLGIVLLILACACGAGLLLAAVWGMRSLAGLGWLAGLIACGIVLFDPVRAAFHQFGTLGTGAWLGLVGGLLIAVGSMLETGLRRTGPV